ncbi:hypothetical protein CAPTEDRAFT_191936 [Capitella teleta]|uniref:Peptidase S9 prolyl oligopeptidase catalytic domain-containing protein n=1 Tax=Capitella teleta TaxID=283909 RepID=R7V1M4_CAPTE|nr:hypothetical protein CAPTEDRAFT_191936 [Capitella teleta]|eukprot:ELU12464.1 hypothetical protein CAPTEDRAFT_191936 [Capitella teleta]
MDNTFSLHMFFSIKTIATQRRGLLIYGYIGCVSVMGFLCALRFITIACLLSAAAAGESSAFVRDEIERMSSAGLKCAFKGKQEWRLDHARENLNANEAAVCHLEHLKSKPDDVWAWSSLCHIYDKISDGASRQKCYTGVPAGNDLVVRNEWRYLAPFTVGKAEVDGDPVENFGGIREAAKSRYTGDFRAYTELLPHGEVGWEVVREKKDGEVLIAPKVDWGDLVRSLGSTAITEWQGWAVASFAVNSASLTVDIQCMGVHTFFIDEVPLTGDVYHRQQYWTSIRLNQGIHDIYIRLRAKISQIFNWESFLFTFVDHDGSVQHAAAIEPNVRCSLCPVVLSLHGTTVSPQNQADSYKRMEGGRHGAHNWEGPGLLTAITAVDRLQEMTKNSDWLPFKSTDKLIVTGHSMGGHGAWHLATHYPDRVIALIPLAGWNKKEEYGDSNAFFRHDISSSEVDPRLKAILESCVSENEVDRHVSNLKGIPVLARIGTDDRTVHPYFVRRMYRLLKEHEVDVSFVEVPDKEHWWTENDGGCVNDQSIRDFIAFHVMQQQQCTRDGCVSEEKSKYTEGKERFTLTSMNPASMSSMRGLLINRQIVPMTTSTVRVTVDSSSIEIKTRNVKEFRFSVSELRPLHWCKYNIQINGQTLSNEECSEVIALDYLCFTLDESVWKLIDCFARHIQDQQVKLMRSRFISRYVQTKYLDLVYVLEPFAVYLANLFFLTSDAYVRIGFNEEVKDVDNVIYIGHSTFTREFKVLFGLFENERMGVLLFDSLQHRLRISADTPAGLHKVLSGLSENEQMGVLLFDRWHRLHISSDTPAGMRDIISLAAPTIPPMTRSPFSNLVPNFVFTGPDFGRLGPAGYLCAGFLQSYANQTILNSCPHIKLN